MGRRSPGDWLLINITLALPFVNFLTIWHERINWEIKGPLYLHTRTSVIPPLPVETAVWGLLGSIVNRDIINNLDDVIKKKLYLCWC